MAVSAPHEERLRALCEAAASCLIACHSRQVGVASVGWRSDSVHVAVESRAPTSTSRHSREARVGRGREVSTIIAEGRAPAP